METTLQLLEFIRLLNNHNLAEYWNFCFTEFSNSTLIYICALIFLTRVIF